MSGPAAREKTLLRQQVVEWRKALPAGRWIDASVAVCQALRQRPEWQSARCALMYAPVPREIDVWPLVVERMASGQRVVLPRFVESAGVYEAALVEQLDRDLVVGAFGIREPATWCHAVPLNQLDFVLVPGLAFDLAGRRLGRGKGYYDRLLPATGGVCCGLAMDEQVLSSLPAEPHDFVVDHILTPTRWHTCRPRLA